MAGSHSVGLVRVCKWTIFAALVSVPFRNVFSVLVPGTLSLIASELILVAAGFLAFQVLLLRPAYREKLRECLHTLHVQLVILFTVYVILLSVLYVPRSPALAVVGLGVYLAYSQLFWYGLLFLKADDFSGIFEKLLLFVFPVVSLGALLGLVSNNPLVSSQEIAYLGTSDQSVFDTLRATSFTGSSIHLGLYNALLLPLAVGYLALKKDASLSRRLWALAITALGAISLMLSFSRGAWVQAAISLAVVFGCAVGREKIKWRWFASPVIVCAILLIKFRDTLSIYWVRLITVTDWMDQSGNVDRIKTWQTQFSTLADSYFIGSGPASTGNAAAKLGLQSAVSITESSYLKLALELGVVGLALFCLLYFAFTTRCIDLVKVTSKTKHSWLAISLLAVLIGLAMEMAIYQSVETQIVQAFLWFIMAGILVLYKDSRRVE